MTTNQPATLHTLYHHGFLTTTEVVRAALCLAGFPIRDAADLVASLTPVAAAPAAPRKRTRTLKSAPKRWTSDEVDAIRNLYAAGHPIAEIAAALKVRPGQVAGQVTAHSMKRSTK